MVKKELVDRVLSGQTVVRPPLSFWYHFGIQHGGGEVFAKTALDYFFYYDFDFLKVMNDYFYPLPKGLKAIQSASDLQHLTRFDPSESAWQEQFKALQIISKALQDQAYFIDTVFDPWQSLNRYLASENMNTFMQSEPQALLDALEVVADNLIDYCKISLGLGAAGIFLSIPAGSEIISREHFLVFVKPFVEKVLNAIEGLGPMTTLHVHGQDLHFDEVTDLHAPVFNWWDRGPGGPALQTVLSRIPGCVMGGIDQTLVARRTSSFLKEHLREAIALGGDRRFFLANGCSIDTWVHPDALKTIVETVKAMDRQ